MFGEDGFSRPGGVGVPVGTIGMVGTGDSVGVEHASTSRSEVAGFGESLEGSFADSTLLVNVMAGHPPNPQGAIMQSNFLLRTS